MTNRRDEILNRIRRRPSPDVPLPELDRADWITYADPMAQFADTLSGVGGRCVFAESIEAVRGELEQIAPFTAAKKVYSAIPEIPSRNVDPLGVADPHQLEDVDFALLPAAFAVAENAAVWVSNAGLPHRVIHFIAQHVALVVPKNEIVHNMHEAYERLKFDRPGFGCFISGPSKTADIEQSLVIGAHGARSLTVFFVGGAK
jgi:L-lactate dehydrogenase complex protein LldG